MHRGGRGGAVALALSVLGPLTLAACGGAGGAGESRHVTAAHDACSQPVASALRARASLVSHEPDVVTCAYRASNGAVVKVTVDRAPQAQFRWVRAITERGQSALLQPRAEKPQMLYRIGTGAAWIPALRQVLATTGRTLVTVEVVKPAPGMSGRETATAVARVAVRTA